MKEAQRGAIEELHMGVTGAALRRCLVSAHTTSLLT
jgi:hypothetical protein